jgi:AI-2 transport protein TqsA
MAAGDLAPPDSPGNQDGGRPNDRARTVFLGIITVVLAGAALYWLRPVVLPLVIALFLIAVAWPVQLRFERLVSPSIAYIGTALCIAAILSGFAGALALGVALLAAGLPDYLDEFRLTAELLHERAVRMNVPLADMQEWQGERLGGLIAAVGGAVYEGIRLLAIALVFAVLGLIEVRSFRKRLAESFTPERNRQLLAAVEQMAQRFRRALVAYTAISLLTGVLTWLFAVAIGLDFALVWGLLAFILNYILFIGPFLAVIPPGIFALIQFQSVEMLLVTLSGLGLMQFLIGNYLLPKLEGRVVSISPLLVMFSLVFWMLVWGIPGAVMAVPLTVMILVACEQIDGVRWIPLLFRSPHEPPRGESEP